MEYKKVSVIVITYNGKHHLKECFDSLKKQTYKNFDAYLLDNASVDGSSDFIRENYPWMKVIQFKTNYGFAEGYNRAIKMVNTEYVALLNDDTRTDPKWLEELVKAIESDETLFAVGSKILFYDRPDIINHAGAKITIIGAGFDIGFGEKDSPEFNEQKYVGAVCGAGMLVRKEIFEEIGGFDEDYFAYFEDLDLCWRAWLYGYKTLYVPTSVVYHKFGGSWGKRDTPRRIYYCQRNRIIDILKNFEKKNVLLGILFSIPYEFVRIAMFVKDGSLDNVKAVINGGITGLKDITGSLRKRKTVQSKRYFSDTYLSNIGAMCSYRSSIKEYFRLRKV